MADLYNMQELGGPTFLSVSNITPTQEPSGQAFTLNYTVTNHTAMNLNAYGQVTDDTNPTVPLGAWAQAIQRNGGTYQASLSFPNGITTTFNGHIEVGHIGELICDWISDRGGPSALTFNDISTLAGTYISGGQIGNPPFSPTFNNIVGCAYYYTNNGSLGDQYTGCDYYP
jgi:hypothetical protein